MSEENTNQETPEISAGEMQIYEAAKLSPIAASDPEVQEVVKKVEAYQNSTSANNAQTEAKKEETQEPEGKQPESTEEPEKKDPKDIKSFFTQNRETGVEFTEDITEFIKNKYSIDNPDTFINSVDNWRKDAQEKADLEKEYNTLVDHFSNLPEGINKILDDYSKGLDWKESAKSGLGGLDYNSDFGNQKPEEVVKHYFKDFYSETKKSYDDGDIDEIEYKEQIARFSSAAKSLYEQDRTRIEQEKSKMVEQQKEQLERLSGSAKKSLETFRSGNPIFSDKTYQTKLDKIYKDLDKGDISKYFVEKDGTWKSDAVEKLFFAVYGKDEGEKALEAARKDGISQGRQEVVDRGNKTPNVSSSQTKGMTEEQMVRQMAGSSFVGSTLGVKNPFAPKAPSK